MKKLKKQISLLLLMLIFIPQISFAELDGEQPLVERPAVEAQNGINYATEEQSRENELLPENTVQNVVNTDFKQPISKRKVVKKFLLAMFGVAISSFWIFAILSIYNKLRDGFSNKIRTPEGEVSLQTPNNMRNAVKTFLEITDWKK